jgi:hypothetical protein
LSTAPRPVPARLRRADEQAELLDFLVGGEQVALDMGGDELQRGPRRALLLARQALGDPLRQAARGGALHSMATPAFDSAVTQAPSSPASRVRAG